MVCPLSGRDPLVVVRLKLLCGVRRRGCRRALCFFCAFGGFSLLAPFGLRSLLFLTLEFLLTLLEGDAHGPPQMSGSILPLLMVVGLPARFARLAGRLSIVLVRESAATATTTGASATAIAARGSLALGPRFVDLEVAASRFFSVEGGNGLRCLRVIGHFHKSKTASTACFPIGDNMNASDLPKRLEQRRQIGLRGLKIQVSDKKILHAISLPGYRVQNFDKQKRIRTNLPETCERGWSATGGVVCAVPWPQSDECVHALRRTPGPLLLGCADCRPQTRNACG